MYFRLVVKFISETNISQIYPDLLLLFLFQRSWRVSEAQSDMTKFEAHEVGGFFFVWDGTGP